MAGKIHYTEIASPLKGVKAYKFGRCKVLVDQRSGGWHLSISHHRELPRWEEVREARYTFIPSDVTMAMILPPKTEYVNIHEYCFHLFQIESEDKIKPKLIADANFLIKQEGAIEV